MLFVGALSGRYTFDRFFDDSLGVWWLQLRVWATILAAIAAWWIIRREGSGVTHGYTREQKLWFGLLCVVYLYLSGNVVIAGDPEGAPTFAFDTLVIFAQAVLFALVFRSPRDLGLLAWTAELAALTLILFGALGFGNPEVNGLTFAPFGNPITIYRLEFLGFCSALYLALAHSALPTARIAHGLASALALYATFASLSRAATLAALAVIGVIFLRYVTAKAYRAAVALVGITAFAFGAVLALSPALENRFAAADPTRVASDVAHGYEGGHGRVARAGNSGAEIDAEIVEYASVQPNGRILDILARYYLGEVGRFEDLEAEEQRYLAAIAESNEGALPDFRRDLGSFLFGASTLVTVGDGSSRLGMAIQAWRQFRLKPWFGIGLGNYRYYIPRPEQSAIITEKYPHNILLEMLSGAGLAGFVLYALALAAAVPLVMRCVAQSPPLVLFAGYLAFVFLTALFSGNIFDFRLVWLVAIAMIASCRSIGPAGASR